MTEKIEFFFHVYVILISDPISYFCIWPSVTEIVYTIILTTDYPKIIHRVSIYKLQVNVEGRTGGARICVPAWNAVVTAKSEKAGPGL